MVVDKEEEEEDFVIQKKSLSLGKDVQQLHLINLEFQTKTP